MATIHEQIEAARGCGYRKEGGMYLMSGNLWRGCGKLPIPLTSCPCCNQGIKFSRGFSWVSKDLLKDAPCDSGNQCNCAPWADESVKKVGLMFVGEKFYKSPADFQKEVIESGLSKRISSVPKDLVVGETWIMLAHKKAIKVGSLDGSEPDTFQMGVFSAFVPERIEYIVKGTETEEELESLEKRGFKLIKVIKGIPEGKNVETFELTYYVKGEPDKQVISVQAVSRRAAEQTLRSEMKDKGLSIKIMKQ